MKQLPKRIAAVFMALAMMLSSVGAGVAFASSSAVKLVVPSQGINTTFSTMQAAFGSVPIGATDVTIIVTEDLLETGTITFSPATATTVTMQTAPGATVKKINSSFVFGGKSNVTISNFIIDGSDAIGVSIQDTATVTFDAGSTVYGTTTGVRNSTNGTAKFTGGIVSSYVPNGGTSSGSWVTPTPTPTPSATPSPTPTAVLVDKITNLPTSLTLNIGNVYQLSPTVSPTTATDKSLEYWTSNSSIVSVTSSGSLTARANGRAYIIVRSKDGAQSVSFPVDVIGGTATATAKPTATASPTGKPASGDSPVYALRNAVTSLNGTKVSSQTTKSKVRVTRRPLKYAETGINKITFPANTITYLDLDGYESLRYDLPWLSIDIFEDAIAGVEGTKSINLAVQRITPTGTMKTQWNKISSKNVSGPWTITSNINGSGFVLRVDLPELIYKSKLKLVRWNGSNFVEVSRNSWSVVKLGSEYMVRTDLVSAGTYAVVRT